MRILALDMAMFTGWATTNDGRLPAISGTHMFGGDRGQRLCEFRHWLSRQIYNFSPELLLYERPFCRGLAATRSGWGMAGIADAAAHAAGIPQLDVVPAAIKKACRAIEKPLGAVLQARKDGFPDNKCHVVATVRELGFDPKTSDEADALALLLLIGPTAQKGELK